MTGNLLVDNTQISDIMKEGQTIVEVTGSLDKQKPDIETVKVTSQRQEQSRALKHQVPVLEEVQSMFFETKMP